MDCPNYLRNIRIASLFGLSLISLVSFAQTDSTKQTPDTINQKSKVLVTPQSSDTAVKVVATDSTKIKPQTEIIKPAEKTQENKSASPAKIARPSITPDTMRLDTIIKKTGGKMKVKVEGKNLFEILFKMPGQKITKKMSTSSIREIRYANGKIEVLDNNPEKRPKDWIPPVSEVEYSKIIIAKDESATNSLIEMGDLEAIYESKKMMTENSFLEKNALIILRKKAVALKATTILVTFKEVTRQYGEFPFITMKATAYGTGNPPSEE